MKKKLNIYNATVLVNNYGNHPYSTNNFDTTNTSNMDCVFGSCSKLENIDLSSWSTANVTNIAWNILIQKKKKKQIIIILVIYVKFKLN